MPVMLKPPQKRSGRAQSGHSMRWVSTMSRPRLGMREWPARSGWRSSDALASSCRQSWARR
eukprot:16434899-Heterocapsa_arctica.AAC.1